MSQEKTEGTLIKFDVKDAPITRGENELIVRLIKGQSPHFEPVTLKEVRLNIHYR